MYYKVFGPNYLQSMSMKVMQYNIFDSRRLLHILAVDSGFVSKLFKEDYALVEEVYSYCLNTL